MGTTAIAAAAAAAAVASPSSSSSAFLSPQFQLRRRRQVLSPFTSSTTTNITSSSNLISKSPWNLNRLGLVACSPPHPLHAAISRPSQGEFDSELQDSELRSVLELATYSELYELERILFGTSYFSPFLKSISKPSDVDYLMIEEDLNERDKFIAILESRFLFLAADARSTIRGWRPSYRDVLLAVRKKLNIPCSRKLSTEDLEIEIFLHLLQDCSSEQSGKSKSSNGGRLEVGLNQWKLQAIAALKVGTTEFRSLFLKGGSMFTLGNLYGLLARRLSGKMFLEAANYQIKKEMLRKGGRLAAVSLESRAALFAAKQGVAGAATRYLGLRSVMTLFGPMLWGTFLADVVIQMLGTDYARILRAIYAFAQIRISRTYKLSSDDNCDN